jgi:hypothetical protein
MTIISYDPACDWYVRYETFEHNGLKYSRKDYMAYYWVNTSIPKVIQKRRVCPEI